MEVCRRATPDDLLECDGIFSLGEMTWYSDSMVMFWKFLYWVLSEW